METADIQANIAARETAQMLIDVFQLEVAALESAYGKDALWRCYKHLRDEINSQLPDGLKMNSKQTVKIVDGARNQQSYSTSMVTVWVDAVCRCETDKAIKLEFNDHEIWLPKSQARFPDFDVIPGVGDVIKRFTLPEWLAVEKDLDYEM